MTAEYGPSGAFRLPDVTVYDGEGKEIEVPRCSKCGTAKCQLIGKEAFVWICMHCGSQ